MKEVCFESSLLDTRMAAAPDSPVSRQIGYELRETSLLNGNANGVNGNAAAPRLMIDKATQFEGDMELNNVADLNGGTSMNSFTPPSRESEITPEWSSTALSETIPMHVKAAPTDDEIKAWRREADPAVTSSSTSDAQQKPPQQQPTTDDGPRYKINQNDPATPDAESQTNTSTWRVRDRNRNSSGSDDDIEKISELVFDVADGEKGKQGRGDDASNANTEPVRDPSSKPNGQRRGDDDDSDCVVQCLSYTLQCCECVIS